MFNIIVVAQWWVVVAQWLGCGGLVVERQATNPVVPSSNPGQSYSTKNFLGIVKWLVKIVQRQHMS